MRNLVLIVGYILLGIFLISIASIIIPNLAKIISDFFQHVQYLTRHGEWIPLILIAALIGWILSMLKKNWRR